MAVSLRGLGLSVIALGIVLLPALRSEREPEPGESQRRAWRLGELRGRQDVARQYWSAISERDSGTALAARAPFSQKPTVMLRGFAARAHAPAADRAVDSIWKQLDRVDSSVRVALVIYNDAPYSSIHPRWYNYYGASIARSDTGISCVALISSGDQGDGAVTLGRNRAGKEQIAQALSPCLMLARFGAPGREVGAWLSATRWAAAGSTAWLNRPRGFIDGDQAPPWYTFRYDYGTEGEPRRSLLLSNRLTDEVMLVRNPPYRLGGPGLRCVAGDAASCTAGVLASDRIVAGTKSMPADLTFRESMLMPSQGFTLLKPRLPGSWWLSDIIRDQGREKFARFWTSDQPFEAAFQSAFGEELGVWTQRWAQRQWENSFYERHHRRPVVLGTIVAPSWPLLALGWTVVALLATVSAARRRQVT